MQVKPGDVLFITSTLEEKIINISLYHIKDTSFFFPLSKNAANRYQTFDIKVKLIFTRGGKSGSY